MYQRFTDRARNAVICAIKEAEKLGQNYVSPEHLLMGLIRESDNNACRILDRVGTSLPHIRSGIERQFADDGGFHPWEMQLTPRGKQVIDLAYDGARQLYNNYVGTEHLLLGVMRESEGIAGKVLAGLGGDLERIRLEARALQKIRAEQTKSEAAKEGTTV